MHGSGLHPPSRAHRNNGELKTPVAKRLHRLQDRLVLNRSSNQVASPVLFAVGGETQYGKIVAFGCTARQQNVVWIVAGQQADLAPRVLDGSPCSCAKLMTLAASVTALLCQIRSHLVQHTRFDRCRSIAIQIDGHEERRGYLD